LKVRHGFLTLFLILLVLYCSGCCSRNVSKSEKAAQNTESAVIESPKELFDNPLEVYFAEKSKRRSAEAEKNTEMTTRVEADEKKLEEANEDIKAGRMDDALATLNALRNNPATSPLVLMKVNFMLAETGKDKASVKEAMKGFGEAYEKNTKSEEFQKELKSDVFTKVLVEETLKKKDSDAPRDEAGGDSKQ
jgi:hypothetical protein